MSAHHEALQAELDRLLAECEVPGAVVGIVDGDNDYVATAGFARHEERVAVTPDTLFLIGSTSKTVTATAAMRQIEDVAYALTDRVVDVLPGFELADRNARDTVRIEHLFTHSGGFLGDADEASSWGDDALARSIDSFRTLPQLFEPGRIASYSNAGIRVLGRIVEHTAQVPFESVIQRTVFDPLGMTNSFYYPWDIATRPHAVGHVVNDGTTTPARLFGTFRESAPEGGISSTIGDQLRYARFHLSGESANGAPVSDETRTLMQQHRQHAGPPIDGFGLSWLLSTVDGHRVVKHGGNIADLQLSEFVLLPDDDLAVIVMTNSSAGKVLGARITAWALEHFRGITETPRTDDFAAPQALEDAVGTYDANQWTNEVTRDGDILTIAMRFRPDLLALGIPQPAPFRARLTTTDTLVSEAGKAIGALIRDDNGAVRFLHLGLRATTRI